MKKLLVPVLALLMFSACSKSNEDKDGSSPATLEVKQDGQPVTFIIKTALLSISTGTNEKRLDIFGTNADSSKKIDLTFYEDNALGNGIAVKTYPVFYFNNDDENTVVDESEDNTEGLLVYGVKSGNNWFYDIFGTQASFSITSCDENARKVSGTFRGKLINLDDNTIHTEFTEGKFNNVTYTLIKF